MNWNATSIGVRTTLTNVEKKNKTFIRMYHWESCFVIQIVLANNFQRDSKHSQKLMLFQCKWLFQYVKKYLLARLLESSKGGWKLWDSSSKANPQSNSLGRFSVLKMSWIIVSRQIILSINHHYLLIASVCACWHMRSNNIPNNSDSFCIQLRNNSPLQ